MPDNRTQNQRQQRAVTALAAMLAHGAREGLPALHWSVNMLSDLIGDVHGLTATLAEQRAAYEAWCDYLGAQRWAERTDSNGTTHLHAVFTWADDDRVKGAIRARLFPGLDAESTA